MRDMSQEVERTAQQLRELGADHAAYEIANGLREILSQEDSIRRQGSDRLRTGLRDVILMLLPRAEAHGTGEQGE